jgi:hypothetical protein
MMRTRFARTVEGLGTANTNVLSNGISQRTSSAVFAVVPGTWHETVRRDLILTECRLARGGLDSLVPEVGLSSEDLLEVEDLSTQNSII